MYENASHFSVRSNESSPNIVRNGRVNYLKSPSSRSDLAFFERFEGTYRGEWDNTQFPTSASERNDADLFPEIITPAPRVSQNLSRRSLSNTHFSPDINSQALRTGFSLYQVPLEQSFVDRYSADIRSSVSGSRRITRPEDFRSSELRLECPTRLKQARRAYAPSSIPYHEMARQSQMRRESEVSCYRGESRNRGGRVPDSRHRVTSEDSPPYRPCYEGLQEYETCHSPNNFSDAARDLYHEISPGEFVLRGSSPRGKFVVKEVAGRAPSHRHVSSERYRALIPKDSRELSHSPGKDAVFVVRSYFCPVCRRSERFCICPRDCNGNVAGHWKEESLVRVDDDFLYAMHEKKRRRDSHYGSAAAVACNTSPKHLISSSRVGSGPGPVLNKHSGPANCTIYRYKCLENYDGEGDETMISGVSSAYGPGKTNQVYRQIGPSVVEQTPHEVNDVPVFRHIAKDDLRGADFDEGGQKTPSTKSSIGHGKNVTNSKGAISSNGDRKNKRIVPNAAVDSDYFQWLAHVHVKLDGVISFQLGQTLDLRSSSDALNKFSASFVPEYAQRVQAANPTKTSWPCELYFDGCSIDKAGLHLILERLRKIRVWPPVGILLNPKPVSNESRQPDRPLLDDSVLGLLTVVVKTATSPLRWFICRGFTVTFERLQPLLNALLSRENQELSSPIWLSIEDFNDGKASPTADKTSLHSQICRFLDCHQDGLYCIADDKGRCAMDRCANSRKGGVLFHLPLPEKSDASPGPKDGLQRSSKKNAVKNLKIMKVPAAIVANTSDIQGETQVDLAKSVSDGDARGIENDATSSGERDCAALSDFDDNAKCAAPSNVAEKNHLPDSKHHSTGPLTQTQKSRSGTDDTGNLQCTSSPSLKGLLSPEPCITGPADATFHSNSDHSSDIQLLDPPNRTNDAAAPVVATVNSDFAADEESGPSSSAAANAHGNSDSSRDIGVECVDGCFTHANGNHKKQQVSAETGNNTSNSVVYAHINIPPSLIDAKEAKGMAILRRMSEGLTKAGPNGLGTAFIAVDSGGPEDADIRCNEGPDTLFSPRRHHSPSSNERAVLSGSLAGMDMDVVFASSSSEGSAGGHNAQDNALDLPKEQVHPSGTVPENSDTGSKKDKVPPAALEIASESAECVEGDGNAGDPTRQVRTLTAENLATLERRLAHITKEREIAGLINSKDACAPSMRIPSNDSRSQRSNSLSSVSSGSEPGSDSSQMRSVTSRRSSRSWKKSGSMSPAQLVSSLEETQKRALPLYYSFLSAIYMSLSKEASKRCVFPAELIRDLYRCFCEGQKTLDSVPEVWKWTRFQDLLDLLSVSGRVVPESMFRKLGVGPDTAEDMQEASTTRITEQSVGNSPSETHDSGQHPNWSGTSSPPALSPLSDISPSPSESEATSIVPNCPTGNPTQPVFFSNNSIVVTEPVLPPDQTHRTAGGKASGNIPTVPGLVRSATHSPESAVCNFAVRPPPPPPTLPECISGIFTARPPPPPAFASIIPSLPVAANPPAAAPSGLLGLLRPTNSSSGILGPGNSPAPEGMLKVNSNNPLISSDSIDSNRILNEPYPKRRRLGPPVGNLYQQIAAPALVSPAVSTIGAIGGQPAVISAAARTGGQSAAFSATGATTVPPVPPIGFTNMFGAIEYDDDDLEEHQPYEASPTKGLLGRRGRASFFDSQSALGASAAAEEGEIEEGEVASRTANGKSRKKRFDSESFDRAVEEALREQNRLREEEAKRRAEDDISEGVDTESVSQDPSVVTVLLEDTPDSTSSGSATDRVEAAEPTSAETQ